MEVTRGESTEDAVLERCDWVPDARDDSVLHFAWGAEVTKDLLNGWRSMDSAPRCKVTGDGKECEPILAWQDFPQMPVRIVWWLDDVWTDGEDYYESDHFEAWQPLPGGPR